MGISPITRPSAEVKADDRSQRPGETPSQWARRIARVEEASDE